MKNIIKITSSVALAAAFIPMFTASAYEQLTSQLDPGARGVNVTRLQSFLSGNVDIYPEGIISGYFGSLTKSAVTRFQSMFGFSQVGRVGPMTLEKINSLIANGGWNTNPTPTGDISAPVFYNVVMTGPTSNQVSFTFTTNENTIVRVAYSTTPLSFNEGDINSNGFGVIGGTFANGTNGLTNNHLVTIQNLSSNTTYYYTVIATDAAGNVSVYGVNNTFRTN